MRHAVSLLNIAAVGIALVLTLTACFSENAPNVGTITIDNQSGSRIGWVVDDSGRPLEQILSGEVSAKPVAAGVTGSLQSSGSENNGWCEPDAVIHLLVEGIEFDPVWESATVAGESVEVIASFGPGHCWGERNVTIVYDG